MSDDPVLAVSGLRKMFGDAAVLRGLDFTVAPGEFVSVLGASGGGKTTLLRILCGFERADAGVVRLRGVVVDGPDGSTGRRLHRRPEQRRIGYVAQEGGLFPHLSVAANIVFGLARGERADPVRIAAPLLERVGLPAAWARRAPHSLSGGEQQRVALARALAPQPSVVLLDEPFSALDAGSRVGTRRAVADALRASGATALLVTHDQGEALSMGDRVGVLRRGVLAQFDTPAMLYRRPIDPELAAFVGEAVLLDAQARHGVAETPLGPVPLDPPVADGRVRVLLRPEQIRIGPDAAGPDGAGNPMAVVASVTYHGHDAGISLVLPTPGAALHVQSRIDGTAALALQSGDRVAVRVTGSAFAFPFTADP